MKPDITPPPEGSEIELEPIAVSQGTMAEDFTRKKPKSRVGRTLAILAGLICFALIALALVAMYGARKFQEASESAVLEVRKLVDEDTPEAPVVAPPQEIADTYAPTGKTIPGMVFIDSIPAGAKVRIAGEEVGETPLMLGRAFEGAFVPVEVRKAGYFPWKGKVQVVGGGLRADITLKPR